MIFIISNMNSSLPCCYGTSVGDATTFIFLDKLVNHNTLMVRVMLAMRNIGRIDATP